ncbi:DUF3842 family protein [Desulfatitalea tepidiphila]|uniref:DUF3842 family protein n=1 Tax=Desulfatitalea tepidiphila TaxID=1185843 RepID=UPI0006B58A4D|nr:DUF3842 family protein [Desulfatitalea tepidiphila]
MSGSVKRKRICVVDGQGGGIGSVIIKRLKEVYGESVEIIALGTNAIATAQMLKAKANRGASGENAIVQTVSTADIIIGAMGIILANAMMGEVTPKMAAAIASSPSPKLILPLSQENITVVGASAMPLPHLVDELVDQHLKRHILLNE